MWNKEKGKYFLYDVDVSVLQLKERMPVLISLNMDFCTEFDT